MTVDKARLQKTRLQTDLLHALTAKLTSTTEQCTLTYSLACLYACMAFRWLVREGAAVSSHSLSVCGCIYTFQT